MTSAARSGRVSLEDLTIRQVIDKVTSGSMRVPAFQRGFVWDANRVAYLMDSIYKKYPFGSILLWRTKDKLRVERNLGPFTLSEGDPDYPVDYILDGQQRITSIFGVFQTEAARRPGIDDWSKIYFDYTADSDAQESRFLALTDEQVDPNKHFLLSNLFDTTAYRRSTKGLSDEIAGKIDILQEIFKEARIPVQLISTEDRATVAIVFERVNQKGVELDTLQLLSAWTWSEDFDLDTKFAELSKELSSFGFKNISEKNLILKCLTAVLVGTSEITDLVNIRGSVVRERFEEVSNGIKGAIDFLRLNLNVHSLDNLPSPNIIIPLSVFFAVEAGRQVRFTAAQKTSIVKWFWRTSFTRRYNSQTAANIVDDIQQITNLKNGLSNTLGDFKYTISETFFYDQEFRINTIASKSLILLLAQRKPKSLISGTGIDLANVLKDYNRNELHHIFPQAYLKSIGEENLSNRLANLTFLSKADNNLISAKPPSVYVGMMPSDRSEILSSCFIPSSFEIMAYDDFLKERAKELLVEAKRLMDTGA